MKPIYIIMLEREMDRRRRLKPEYSLRSFAAFLRLDSSALSRVLNDKQELSVRAAVHIVRKLKLMPEDQERFIVSVAYTRYLRLLAELSKGSIADDEVKISLRASEERFRPVFENVDELVALVELTRDDAGSATDFTVLRVNSSWTKQTGVADRKVIRRPASEWMPERNRPWLELFARVKRTGIAERAEVHSVGLNAWHELYVESSEDDRLVVRGRDVTERRVHEEELRREIRRLAAIANMVPDLLWIGETGGRTLWHNQRWVEYTGYGGPESVAWSWLAVIHPDDRERSALAYAEAIRDGRPFSQIHRMRASDGSYRQFLVRAEPVFDHDTQAWHLYGAATDIQHLHSGDER